MNYGNRLSKERKRLGLNQTDFGRIGGVTKTTQLNYESGERSPNADYWEAIAELGADVQYILTGNRSQSTASIGETSNQYTALTPQERTLLDRYRSSPQELKDAAMRVLLGGQTDKSKIVIHGDVGQKFETPISGGTFNVDMRKSTKK